MPARIAKRTPTNGTPLRSAAAKPQTAPTAIIPSTPRLRTPERSATSSPRAAIRSGVEAVMMVRIDPSSISMGRLERVGRRLGHGPAHQADAVKDEGVAGKHEEEQHALEDAGDLL